MASVITEVSAVCVKSGRTDVFGRPLEVGTFYQLPIGYARSLVQSGHVTVSDLSVFDVDKSPYWLPFGVPISFKFDGFTTGRLVASLVAGSTATRVGLLVTVTATAHGIPSGTYDGSYFFFPGCPSLAAGWYSGFLVVSANAVQFYLPPFWPGGNFSGESVNGGAEYTTQTRVASLTLPANSLTAGSRIRTEFFRDCGTTGATKTTYLFIDSDQFGRFQPSSASGSAAISVWFDGTRLTGLADKSDVYTSPTATSIPKDASLPITVSLDAKISAAADYNYMAGALVDLVQ